MGGAQLPVLGGDIGRIAAGVATMGMSETYNRVAQNVNDPFGAKNAMSNAATKAGQAASDQRAAMAGLATSAANPPKVISPDNFLAIKAKQLAGLRLGLASTITGAAGSPPPVLGTTSLQGQYPGRAKLGS